MRLNVNMDPKMYKALAALAKSERRTISAVVIGLVEAALPVKPVTQRKAAE